MTINIKGHLFSMVYYMGVHTKLNVIYMNIALNVIVSVYVDKSHFQFSIYHAIFSSVN